MNDVEGARARARADVAAGADLRKVCVTGWPRDAVTRELVALTAVGFTPADALRAATIGAAALLKTPGIGEIMVGGTADLVVVQGDPLQDVHVMETPVLVLKAGRPVR